MTAFSANSESSSIASNGSAGTLQAIWAKQARGEPMLASESGALIAGLGLEGSAPTRGKRQVTVLSKEAWERAAAEAGSSAPPETRRANLLVSGVDLFATTGRTLAVGETRILIHGETRPCQRIGGASPGLLDALAPEWRAGAFGEVVCGGPIRVGDRVAWLT